MALSRDDVAQLYIAMFQRAPSQAELDTWYQDAQTHNRDLKSMAETMLQAAMLAVNGFGLQDLYPQYANVNPHDPDSVRGVIASVYESLFNKTYQQDPQGIDTWVNQVVSGKQSMGAAIASIVVIGEGIAKNPDAYRPYFDNDADFQAAYTAAKAFDAKVHAAMEVAQTIQNVKVDRTALEEMKQLIRDVHDENDIDHVRSQAQNIKIYVEDHSSDQGHGQNESSDEGYGEQSLQEYVQEEWQDVKATLSQLPPQSLSQLITLWKQEIASAKALYNQNDHYTPQMLQALAQIEQNLENQTYAIFTAAHIPYEKEIVLPNTRFLEQLDAQTQQKYFNLAKEYYNAMGQYLASVNAFDINSLKPAVMKDAEYWYRLDHIADGPLKYVGNIVEAYGLKIEDENHPGQYVNYEKYKCYDKLENAVSNLSEAQQVELTNKLNDYVNTSPYFQDHVLDSAEYQHVLHDLEGIYGQFGINIAQAMNSCDDTILPLYDAEW